MLLSVFVASFGLLQASALEYTYPLSASDPFLVVSPQPELRNTSLSTNATTFSARSGLQISVNTPLIGAQFEGRIVSASSANLLLQTGKQRKNEIATQGEWDTLIGDSFPTSEGEGGTKLSTTFDGDLVLRQVSLTFNLVSSKTAFNQQQSDEQPLVASDGKLAPGPQFDGDWSVAETSIGSYARGKGIVSIPLLAGTSFAVLTGVLGKDMGNYSATLVPAREGAKEGNVTYSARNAEDGTGVLWLGALDPGTQHALRLESAQAMGLYKLRQYGDSLAVVSGSSSSPSSPSGSASPSPSSSAPTASPKSSTNIGAIARCCSSAAARGAIEEEDKPEGEYRAIVEDFVTPYTLSGGSTQSPSSASGKGGPTMPASTQARPNLHVETGVREADAGPLPEEPEQTLPPLYDPTWRSASSPSAPSTPVASMPTKR
ncbi:hypothetical protein A1Q1_02772 [Trichosporon asahii var. asahii CBS 2479]|uniref:Uncharacterized protein n=1 Tax=Trichosporon asahii var. asahii (strain ATCC 90039 / CBS 2479 / JCM 2466 / KCTC 7840 / NBRC 103889/ NCYC 2677 / UAMH 7654) TaxID=1186058 RepID=J5SYG3_TRIAS|nr:hypothetical protein A1Q1_02772 [Trichosporon asahii var. asahii CBS 2479]EJT48206.1 hypothetical protein A1Q1_02772 [Trichosporon asahii var. asahii CBS 2479]